MADNRFNISVVTSDNGTTKLVERNINSLGGSVNRTNQRFRDGSKDSKDFYDTQAKGVIGTANSTKSFSKLAESIGGRSNGLVAAYAELAANIFAVSAAFNALRGASQVEQILKGLEAAGSRTGQALTVTARNLKEVTGSAIDTEQALRSTAQIASAGFDSETVERFGRAARDTSFALGRNMTDALDRLTRGVIKLEPELLDELGIMTKLTESNTLYAAKLGKTETQLSAYEKRQGFLNAVLAEAELKFGGLSDAAGNSLAYDRLASTFSDLRNETLNMLNGALKPLAEVLASSPTALLGVAILFGSTLATRLLPFLADSVSSARRAAEATRAHAGEMSKAAKEAYVLAKAEQDTNVNRLRSLRVMSTDGPKAYNAVRDSINQGTASIKEQQQAITSLERSIRANRVLMENNPKFAEGTAGGTQKTREIAEAQQEIVRIRELAAAREVADKTTSRGLENVKKAWLLQVAAAKEASAAEARAAAIGAASQGNVRTAIQLTTHAMQEYAASLVAVQRSEMIGAQQTQTLREKIAGTFAQLKASVMELGNSMQTSALTPMNKLRVATYGLATAAKAAGSAFLAAIPAIGQLVFALGILKTAYDYLKPENVKKLEKAYEDYKEVLDSTSKSIEAYKRAQMSSADLAIRTREALTIQSNAVKTLADAYNQLSVEQNELKSKGSGDKGVAGIFGTLTATGYASYLLQIKESSKALQAFKNDLPSALGTPGGVENDPQLAGAITTLDKLTKLAPEATAKAISFAGGWERFTKLPLEAKIAAVDGIVKKVNDTYGQAADRVTELADAFKQLNQAISDFALSQQQTTPYDQVVKGFQAVTNGIRGFQSAAANSALANSDQYKSILAGIGSGAEAFLSVDTKQQLDSFRLMNDQVQQMENAKAKGLAVDQARLTNLTAVRDIQSKVLDTIAQELLATQKTFQTAQEMDRVLKSQQAVLQANLAANQANYATTASGVKARMEGENRIKAIQIQQLEVQKNLIQQYIMQTRAQIDLLNLQIDQIKASYDFNKSIDEGNVLLNLRAAREREAALAKQLENSSVSPNDVLSGKLSQYSKIKLQIEGKGQLVEDFIAANKLAEALNQVQSKYQAIEKARQAITGYEASVKNLANQQQVLAISQNTQGQIAAEMNAKRVEILNQQLGQLQEQRKTIDSIVQLENKSAVLASGRAESLADQYTEIARSAKEQRAAIETQYTQNRRTIEAELQKARADGAKAANASDKQANRDRIALLQEQLRIEEQGYGISLRQIDAQTQYNILEKAAFDTQSTGLTIQKDALQYLERSLDVQKSLVDATREQNQLRAEIARRSTGRIQTEFSKKNDEIEAARDAYRFAIQEADLKKTVIKLEYALLEAQRLTTLQNLQAQRELLASVPNVNQEMVKQLDAAIGGLKSASDYVGRAQEQALRLADKTVENAYLRMIQTALPEGRSTRFSDQVRDYDQLKRTRDEVLSGDAATKYKQAFEPVISPMTAAVKTLEVSMSGLGMDIRDLRATLDAQIADKSKVSEAATNSTLSRMSIRDAAAAAAAAGLRVSEMKGYGGVNPVHKGAGHYEDRAFDLNIGVGNREWDNPKMKATFDKWAADFRAQGLKVLWGVKGHFDHMHVEIPKVINKAMMKVVDVTKTVVQEAERKIENTDIVVTGTRIPANDNMPIVDPRREDQGPVRQPASSEFLDKFQIIMDQPNSISEVFRKMAEELGPEGQIVPVIIDGIQSIGDSYLKIQDVFSDKDSTFADKFTAIASAAQTALSTISSALAAGAQAKEAAIQREIDAEQRRDGKSAESVQKIQSLERKKDEIARKQFNTNKKLMMAQAVIGTAAGIAQALGSLPPPASIIMAGVIGALGAAQLAIIAGTQYQSTASNANKSAEIPTLTIGKQGNAVDLAKNNPNLGGELGYLRGNQGVGSNASNYRVIGSAYGGDLPRGYGNSAFVVGEKGPETITPQVPMTVRPANDVGEQAPLNATINIRAIDSQGVADVLKDQRGNIISMLREAANASGQNFLEDVDVNVYTRPNVSKL